MAVATVQLIMFHFCAGSVIACVTAHFACVLSAGGAGQHTHQAPAPTSLHGNALEERLPSSGEDVPEPDPAPAPTSHGIVGGRPSPPAAAAAASGRDHQVWLWPGAWLLSLLDVLHPAS